jgi:uncharacterized protein with HEPN domain
MKREEKKYLFDILESIEAIELYLHASSTYQDFSKNQMLQDATIRRLEIIGEATIQLLKISPALIISDSRKIKGLRNRIAHEYDMIEIDEVWIIIQRNLPILKQEIKQLLEK